MHGWSLGEVRSLELDEIGERYRQYRLSSPEAEEAMRRSLHRYGQVAPVVFVVHEERPELVDGFKRLEGARRLGMPRTLLARRIDGDERTAKAAIYALNSVGRHTQELEEAWIVQALVREDGLAQTEVAELLGRHKSWVCRRLALLEKLADAAKEDLRLGLLSPTQARELLRLPTGNQTAVLQAARSESLGTTELHGVVDLVLASASPEKVAYVLAQPREALRQAQQILPPSWDPRLSAAGNRIGRQLGSLLDQLSRMETWLTHRGRAELTLADRAVLQPSFARLATDSHQVAERADDLAKELDA